MLRCLLAGRYESQWFTLILEVERNLDCLPTDATSVTPFEILYGVKPCVMPALPGNQQFVTDCTTLHIAVRDAMELAQSRMAMIFDKSHQLPNISEFVVSSVRAIGKRLPVSISTR